MNAGGSFDPLIRSLVYRGIYVSIVQESILPMDIVIGLIGQKLTGKDTVAQYLTERYGAVSVVYSHVLDDVLRILDQEVSRENEMRLAIGLRSAFGDAILNAAVLKRITDYPEGIRLINGIRRPEEAEQARAAGVRLVYVSASPEERYRRYMLRQEKQDDGTLSFEAFMEQDASSPTEKDIPALKGLCEYTIQNESDLTALQREVDVCLEVLSNTKK